MKNSKSTLLRKLAGGIAAAFLMVTSFNVNAQTPATVVDIIVDSENHTTLEAAVTAAGLVSTLQGTGPFTVFAPTDAAFAALPAGTVEALLADIPALTDILTYHVVGGKAMSTDLSDGQMIATVNGKEIKVMINADGVFINDAKVTFADIEADNGVVHVIDAVLLPPTTTVVDIVVNSEDHNTLETAVVAAGLVETLQGEGPFTVFAPTDAAFAALPAGTVEALLADIPALTDILTYHVVAGKAMSTDLSDGQMIATVNGKEIKVTINGDGVFINDAKVIFADIEADNGVVHVIDAVLIPEAEEVPATVVDIIVNSENHTTLEAAVLATAATETIEDFEGEGNPSITAFGNIVANEIMANPDKSGINVSDTVVKFTKTAGSETWAGAFFEPGFELDFDTYNMVKMKTWSPKAGAAVRFKIENQDNSINYEVEATTPTTVANAWEELTFDMTEAPEADYVRVVVFFDFGVAGDDSEYYYDDIRLANTDLASVLQGEGPFTVFAPTDDAFAAIPAETISALLASPGDDLTDILLYHVVAGKAMSTDLSDGQEIQTVFGENITVTINNDGVFINDAKVIVADLEAENGVVHVIDAVLMPGMMPETVVDIVVNSEVHETLETAVIAAGLVETLQGDGPFTVFAPTDDAFAALPAGTIEALLADPSGDLTDILLYHVVAGKAMSTDLTDGQVIETVFGENITVTISNDGVFINDAKVIVADIEAGNGVVHVIDAVLIPQMMPATVVDIVVNSEVHETLETAVIAAGLVETLQGEGPFTVFAPTDAAFAALPAGTVEALLADIPALTDILTYHVVAGKAMSTDLTDGQEIATVFGENITVTINNDGVFINNAKVIVADIEAGNGVVHVIDAVLLPPTGVFNSMVERDMFSIYPNPANTMFTFELSGNEEFMNGQAEIIRIDGTVMRTIRMDNFSTNVDISAYESGVYFVRYTKDNNYSIQKLVIKK